MSDHRTPARPDIRVHRWVYVTLSLAILSITAITVAPNGLWATYGFQCALIAVVCAILVLVDTPKWFRIACVLLVAASALLSISIELHRGAGFPTYGRSYHHTSVLLSTLVPVTQLAVGWVLLTRLFRDAVLGSFFVPRNRLFVRYHIWNRIRWWAIGLVVASIVLVYRSAVAEGSFSHYDFWTDVDGPYLHVRMGLIDLAMGLFFIPGSIAMICFANRFRWGLVCLAASVLILAWARIQVDAVQGNFWNGSGDSILSVIPWGLLVIVLVALLIRKVVWQSEREPVAALGELESSASDSRQPTESISPLESDRLDHGDAPRGEFQFDAVSLSQRLRQSDTIVVCIVLLAAISTVISAAVPFKMLGMYGFRVTLVAVICAATTLTKMSWKMWIGCMLLILLSPWLSVLGALDRDNGPAWIRSTYHRDGTGFMILIAFLQLALASTVLGGILRKRKISRLIFPQHLISIRFRHLARGAWISLALSILATHFVLATYEIGFDSIVDHLLLRDPYTRNSVRIFALDLLAGAVLIPGFIALICWATRIRWGISVLTIVMLVLGWACLQYDVATAELRDSVGGEPATILPFLLAVVFLTRLLVKKVVYRGGLEWDSDRDPAEYDLEIPTALGVTSPADEEAEEALLESERAAEWDETDLGTDRKGIGTRALLILGTLAGNFVLWMIFTSLTSDSGAQNVFRWGQILISAALLTWFAKSLESKGVCLVWTVVLSIVMARHSELNSDISLAPGSRHFILEEPAGLLVLITVLLTISTWILTSLGSKYLLPPDKFPWLKIGEKRGPQKVMLFMGATVSILVATGMGINLSGTRSQQELMAAAATRTRPSRDVDSLSASAIAENTVRDKRRDSFRVGLARKSTGALEAPVLAFLLPVVLLFFCRAAHNRRHLIWVAVGSILLIASGLFCLTGSPNDTELTQSIALGTVVLGVLFQLAVLLRVHRDAFSESLSDLYQESTLRGSSRVEEDNLAEILAHATHHGAPDLLGPVSVSLDHVSHTSPRSD